jgi:hypothetical protein
MLTVIYSIGLAMIFLGGLIVIVGQIISFRHLPDQRRKKLGSRIALIAIGWIAILFSFLVLFVVVLHK